MAVRKIDNDILRVLIGAIVEMTMLSLVVDFTEGNSPISQVKKTVGQMVVFSYAMAWLCLHGWRKYL